MTMVESAETRKARGAFFTPPLVCKQLADWAIRTPTDKVLEPSCGEAAFLIAAVSRLHDLGAKVPSVAGVEIHNASAIEARRVVRERGGEAVISVGDFLASGASGRYDAVIGDRKSVV